jgi:chromosome segregation ATPase
VDSTRSPAVTVVQDNHSRRIESKINFLENELRHSNAELSRTKAKLSSCEIELEVLRAQLEKLERKTPSRQRDIYSTSGSSASHDPNSSVTSDSGLSPWHRAMATQVDAVERESERAERRALEKCVQSLHVHASSLREENVALHQSLREALASLAELRFLSHASTVFLCFRAFLVFLPCLHQILSEHTSHFKGLSYP